MEGGKCPENFRNFWVEIDKMMVSNITGKTKLLGVIGNPIEHSVSPLLHNTISRELGLDIIYVPFRVEPGDLENAIKGIRALNIAGFNVTIPYKRDILQLIDETDKNACLIGAVNTVKNMGGRLIGYNTDADGFARAFKEDTGSTFIDKKVALLGAGGAARALAVKIAAEGASDLFIINRTKEKADQIAQLVNREVNNIARSLVLNTENSREVFSECDIIINTIPVGMYPDVGKSPVDEKYKFRSGQIVYDAIYNPFKTLFLSKAEQNGCLAVNGLSWLFYQGVMAFEIWTGIKLDGELLKKIFLLFKDMIGKTMHYS